MVNKKIRVFKIGDVANNILPDELTIMKFEKVIRSVMQGGGEMQLYVPPFVETYEIEMQVPENKYELADNLRLIKELDKKIKILESKKTTTVKKVKKVKKDDKAK